MVVSAFFEGTGYVHVVLSPLGQINVRLGYLSCPLDEARNYWGLTVPVACVIRQVVLFFYISANKNNPGLIVV